MIGAFGGKSSEIWINTRISFNEKCRLQNDVHFLSISLS